MSIRRSSDADEFAMVTSRCQGPQLVTVVGIDGDRNRPAPAVAATTGVQRVLVAREAPGDAEATLSLVGAAAAEYLEGILSPADVVGIS
jgi:DNA-binding transcriptional regulator LsrR (DeoR family)